MSKLAPDFIDLLRELSVREARFLVVGGYALGQHGRPRATGDLDIWVEASSTNALRVHRALAEFGAPLGDLTIEELSTPGIVFQMGAPPYRIDILTEISGVDFETAWTRRMEGRFGDESWPVIGLEDLIRNKRATGRAKDLLDAEALERVQKLTSRR
jgi:hypothetical protein